MRDPRPSGLTTEDLNRPAELLDVINAIKSIVMDKHAEIRVLNATIDFLTQKMNEDNEIQD